MDKSIIADVAAFTGLFLFTGAEVGIESTIFEIISKFGVVAVLWFWLKDMKSQMRDQLNSFTEETKLLREDHKETLKEFGQVHEEHRRILSDQLIAKDTIINNLQSKIRD